MVQVQKRGKRKGEVKDVEKKGILYIMSTRSLVLAECRVKVSTSLGIERACWCAIHKYKCLIRPNKEGPQA